MRNDVIVTLSNGKRVANFSSPHEFKFEDGSVLPAVSGEVCVALSLEVYEDVVNKQGDLRVYFQLTDEAQGEMEDWYNLYQRGLVDVVFCPLPMMEAIKGDGETVLIMNGEGCMNVHITRTPFRAVRMANRVEKILSIDNQCI